MVSIEAMYATSPDEDEEARTYAVSLVMGACLRMTLKAAIELQPREIIVKDGHSAQLSPAHIATQLPTGNPHAADTVDRILRLLATYGIFCL